MSTTERIEMIKIMDLINSIQNKNNSFVNITEEDLEQVYQYIKKHDLDYDDTVQLLTDLSFI